jgi:hypothetical protein
MKIMLWFHEGVTPEEIAERLQRNVKPVRKVIAANRILPVHQRSRPRPRRDLVAPGSPLLFRRIGCASTSLFIPLKQ